MATSTSIGILRSIMTLDISGFAKGINRALKDVNRFQRTMTKVSRGLAFFGGAFGLTFGATAAIRGLGRRIDQIGKLSDEADKTGVSLKSLGVDLDRNAVVKVREAARQMDNLRANWARFRDEIVVANVAGPLSRWLDVVNTGRSLKNLLPPPAAAPAAPARSAMEIATQDATSRLQTVRAGRFRSRPTAESIRQQAAKVRKEREAERNEAIASRRAELDSMNQMNTLRSREAKIRRRLLSGERMGDEDIGSLLSGSLPKSMGNSGGRNPLWDMVRQSAPTAPHIALHREMQELNDTQKKALEELKRLDEIWERELQRQADEKASGGVNIN